MKKTREKHLKEIGLGHRARAFMFSLICLLCFKKFTQCRNVCIFLVSQTYI
jgi:hypothetical protein